MRASNVALVAVLSAALFPALGCPPPPDVPPAEGEGEQPQKNVNLTLDVTDVEPSLHVTFREFAADDCEVQSGIVGAAGTRALLGFTLVARNSGDRDFRVAPNNKHLTDSACRGKALVGFVEYRVLAHDGTVVAAGALDVLPVAIAAGGTAPLEIGRAHV